MVTPEQVQSTERVPTGFNHLPTEVHTVSLLGYDRKVLSEAKLHQIKQDIITHFKERFGGEMRHTQSQTPIISTLTIAAVMAECSSTN